MRGSSSVSLVTQYAGNACLCSCNQGHLFTFGKPASMQPTIRPDLVYVRIREEVAEHELGHRLWEEGACRGMKLTDEGQVH